MAHYAFLDENNLVTEVITGVNESEQIDGKDPEQWYSEFRGQPCKRTSYNGKIRKNFAGVGFFYDEQKDAFIPPSPFASWILDEETCQWKSPTPMPEAASYWNELTLSWVEVIKEV